MSDAFIKKNIKLALEFDRYVFARPNLIMKIPNKSIVMFTVKGDSHFNRQSKSLAARAKTGRNKIVEARKEGSIWEIFSPAAV